MKFKIVLLILLIFQVASFNNSLSGSIGDPCVGGEGGFCKNDPLKNDGICTEGISTVCCKKTSGTNKDCYDVGI